MTRELFIEIFETDIRAVNNIENYDVIIEDEEVYLLNRNTLFILDEICIYKAQHKCKEWAYKNGYSLSSEYLNVYSECVIDKHNDGIGEAFESDTEPEAVFKATQWVYDNIKQLSKET